MSKAGKFVRLNSSEEIDADELPDAYIAEYSENIDGGKFGDPSGGVTVLDGGLDLMSDYIETDY